MNISVKPISMRDIPLAFATDIAKVIAPTQAAREQVRKEGFDVRKVSNMLGRASITGGDFSQLMTRLAERLIANEPSYAAHEPGPLAASLMEQFNRASEGKLTIPEPKSTAIAERLMTRNEPLGLHWNHLYHLKATPELKVVMPYLKATMLDYFINPPKQHEDKLSKPTEYSYEFWQQVSNAGNRLPTIAQGWEKQAKATERASIGKGTAQYGLAAEMAVAQRQQSADVLLSVKALLSEFNNLRPGAGVKGQRPDGLNMDQAIFMASRVMAGHDVLGTLGVGEKITQWPEALTHLVGAIQLVTRVAYDHRDEKTGQVSSWAATRIESAKRANAAFDALDKFVGKGEQAAR